MNVPKVNGKGSMIKPWYYEQTHEKPVHKEEQQQWLSSPSPSCFYTSRTEELKNARQTAQTTHLIVLLCCVLLEAFGQPDSSFPW